MKIYRITALAAAIAALTACGSEAPAPITAQDTPLQPTEEPFQSPFEVVEIAPEPQIAPAETITESVTQPVAPVQPEPVTTQLIQPQVVGTSLLVEQWIDSGNGLPEPWLLASMQISWEPQSGHEYFVVVDGAVEPPSVGSPAWYGVDLRGGSQESVFSQLPQIRLRACASGECVNSDVMVWDFSDVQSIQPLQTSQITAAEECPEEVNSLIQQKAISSGNISPYEYPVYNDSENGTICALMDSSSGIPVGLEFQIDDSASPSFLHYDDPFGTVERGVLTEGELGACLVALGTCPEILAALGGQ